MGYDSDDSGATSPAMSLNMTNSSIASPTTQSLLSSHNLPEYKPPSQLPEYKSQLPEYKSQLASDYKSQLMDYKSSLPDYKLHQQTDYKLPDYKPHLPEYKPSSQYTEYKSPMSDWYSSITSTRPSTTSFPHHPPPPKLTLSPHTSSSISSLPY